MSAEVIAAGLQLIMARWAEIKAHNDCITLTRKQIRQTTDINSSNKFQIITQDWTLRLLGPGVDLHKAICQEWATIVAKPCSGRLEQWS